jgi:hypothetical protein
MKSLLKKYLLFVTILLSGFAPAAFAQLQWSSYDTSGNLVSANAGVGGDATYGGTVTFTIPAGTQLSFITKNFSPLNIAAANARVQISFQVSASAGWGGVSARTMGWGLYNSAATASLSDDVGYFGLWNGGGPFIETYDHPSGNANLFAGTKLGQGTANTGSVVNGVVFTNYIQLVMNSSATGISLGTSSSTLANAGLAITGPGITAQRSFTNPVQPLLGGVNTFDEFGFMFNNTTGGSVTITISGLNLVPKNPVINTQPLSFGGSPGDTASFTVGVNTNSGTPLTYQWYEATASATNALSDGATGTGSTISGSTSSNLVFTSAQVADSGNVYVIVTNSYGSVTSSVAQFLISSTPVAPVINYLQPPSATIIAITGVTNIFANAIAVPSPAFYWYDNNSNLIQSGPSPTLTLSGVPVSGGGTYSVIASNSAGTVLSNFVVTVLVPPTISSQPTNLLLNLGDPANFSVTASGIPSPTYQWLKNGSVISGATASNYSIASVVYSNIATYSVVVSNSAGSITSSGAVLAINSPTMVGTPSSPANGASGICYDTPLYITFNGPPTIGKTGKVWIFNTTNTSTPADVLDLSLNTSLNVQPRSNFSGDNQAFNYYPIIITGNTAAIYPHPGVMTYGQSYYVTMDPGVIVDSNAAYYTGFNSSSTWQFSTKAAGPANQTNLVVAPNNSGDFVTVQGAIDSVAPGNTNYTVINIGNGNYTEIVDVAGKHNITFRGQSRTGTVVGYPNNNNINGTTHARMAFKINANDIALENLTVSNSTPQGGSQAEALMVESGARRFIFNNATVCSLQDTILANINSSQGYFYNSTVRGNFDYIWGGGNLFFNKCVMHTVAGASSYNLTAARTDFGNSSLTGNWMTPDGTKWSSNGFSVVACTLEADAGVHNITLAGANGTAGGQVDWITCKIDTNAYIGPTVAIGTSYNLWQYSNTDLLGDPVTFSNLVTLTNGDPRLIAATNVATWLNGWVPQLAPNIVTNPVGQTVSAGGNITLVSYATGIPDPAYQWLKNGTPIPGANAAVYNIPSAMRTNAGSYSVVASNATGSVTSAVAVVAYNNTAPVAVASTYIRQAGVPLRILIPGDLATNWSDVDGDSITLTGAMTSTNGATLAYDSSFVYYTNANDVADLVSYSISDGVGGIGSGTITINVSSVPSVSTVQFVSLNGGNPIVSFTGNAGYQYEIQRSTNFIDWSTLLITNAPAGGAFNFTDTFSDLGGAAPATAFYRTVNP